MRKSRSQCHGGSTVILCKPSPVAVEEGIVIPSGRAHLMPYGAIHRHDLFSKTDMSSRRPLCPFTHHALSTVCRSKTLIDALATILVETLMLN